MRSLTIIFCLALVFPFFSQTQATIIHVPGDSSTIQGGINGAVDGDTVLVQSGTHVENIYFNGHNIVLGSLFLTTGDTSHISSTIIDGNSSGSVVMFASGEGSTAVISGFTMQNGLAEDGGGIHCRNSSPTIRSNTIRGNFANYKGGGIYCEQSDPTITQNAIRGNSGAGICCWDNSGPTITQNAIRGNSGGGIWCGDNSSPTITNNAIRGNSGGGIWCGYNSNPTVSSNTVTRNFAYSGGGIYCLDSSPMITNTIFWGDSSYEGNEIHVHSGSPVITYCDIQGGWAGQGNINVDPLFIYPHNGNYSVCSQSPCIDAGDPGLLDPDGTRSDIGVFYPAHSECFNIRHVSTSGNDATGDGSLYNPFRTIQHSIDVCVFGDTVSVQSGTYIENINFHGHNIVVGSQFLTTGDTSCISSTIIDGDSSGSVVTFESGEDSTVVITGFTMQNGFAEDGGGIHCENSSSIISNNTISGNLAYSGGGIYCYNSNPTIINNAISENVAYHSGGAIYCDESNPTISNSTITGNSADSIDGGGIFCLWSDHPSIRHSTISENSADRWGGGVFCAHSSAIISDCTISGNTAKKGGGVSFWNSNLTPEYSNTIDDCNIIGNSADSTGGGICLIYVSDDTVRNGTISDNSAPFGGGIYSEYSASLNLSKCVVANNTAHENGGGIYCGGGSHFASNTISNCIIAGNTAYSDAGGILAYHFSEPTITNCTISENLAYQNGGGIDCLRFSAPRIKNTIFWSDSALTGDEIYSEDETPTFSYCDIQGGWVGEGNMSVDPLFRDPENGDYHLQSATDPDCGGPDDSPCIDAGDPGIFDILLDCNWGGLGINRSDMGAYGGAGIGSDILEEDILVTPSDFLLFQSYPNPFNQTTKIDFALKNSGFVRLDIYDILGRKVRTLAYEHLSSGYKSVLWNGKNDSGKDVASGMYFYRIKVGELFDTKKMILVK